MNKELIELAKEAGIGYFVENKNYIYNQPKDGSIPHPIIINASLEKFKDLIEAEQAKRATIHTNNDQTLINALFTIKRLETALNNCHDQMAEDVLNKIKINKQNAELVEALEDITSLEHIPSNFGVARTIARSALAKKGE
jgi:type III secretion system FlhB-like substrate exporter